jgi:hypothetical protein
MLKRTPLAFAGAALLALPLQALPSTDRYDWHTRDYRWERHDGGQDHGPEKRLVEKYDRFAGSDRNARELVEGLRNDSQIDLTKGGKTTSFKPATDKMGYGNVDLALGLAKASLADHGIHNPTPEQIKAALNGGTITTKSGQRVTLAGVLKLRASGMGWGQVAHKLGVKVGDVKGHGHAHKKDDGKHHHKHAKHKHDKHDKHDWKHGKDHDRDYHDRHDNRKHAHHHKPDWKDDRHDRKQEHVKHHQHRPEFHRAKFERPERVHRPEKFERPHRPERPERPEKHHRR